MLPQVCKYVEPHTSQTHTTQACAAWDVADAHLANLFGLNESKYEWAVREYYYQKRMEAENVEAKQQANSQVSWPTVLLVLYLYLWVKVLD